jgi:hypothetical protein
MYCYGVNGRKRETYVKLLKALRMSLVNRPELHETWSKYGKDIIF